MRSAEKWKGFVMAHHNRASTFLSILWPSDDVHTIQQKAFFSAHRSVPLDNRDADPNHFHRCCHVDCRRVCCWAWVCRDNATIAGAYRNITIGIFSTIQRAQWCSILGTIWIFSALSFSFWIFLSFWRSEWFANCVNTTTETLCLGLWIHYPWRVHHLRLLCIKHYWVK